MLNGGEMPVSYGKITEGPEADLTLKTICFIYDALPAWRDYPSRPDVNNENSLNAQLCKVLNSLLGHEESPMVHFNHQEPQTGQCSTDISVTPRDETVLIRAMLYSIFDPIFVIECKRLPAPSKDREREYVTGYQNKSGGIQRFKLGLHGADEEIAVMVGYVQGKAIHHWHGKINEWITDLSKDRNSDCCTWNADEILESIEEDSGKGRAKSHSFHQRNGSSRIEIFHLWIDMSR